MVERDSESGGGERGGAVVGGGGEVVRDSQRAMGRQRDEERETYLIFNI